MRMNWFKLTVGALSMAGSTALLIGAAPTWAADNCVMPRPRPAPSVISLSPDGLTTNIVTQPSQFPPGDSFGPNPTNLLPTVYTDMCDSGGVAIPNTLPSTPQHPYNLHADPKVRRIDKTSPTDDLQAIIKELRQVVGRDNPQDDDERGRGQVDRARARFGIDILEGNPLPRAYSGFPLLHYNGPLKTKAVTPIRDASGKVIGGTVTVNQIWYDSHIESDTAYIDSDIVADVPWTIHYRVHVLNRGFDDFAPYSMVFDDPNKNAGKLLPHVGFDQTFFPMDDGTLVEYDMKMSPGRYWNLTYHWGWRRHPPRVQVTENMNMQFGPGMKRNFFEIDTFGVNPRANEAAKLQAISMIGDLAPAKRMWTALRAIRDGANGAVLRRWVDELEASFDDWQHKNRIPRGVKTDENADMNLFYVNNTIYGHIKGYTRDMQAELYQWKKRGDTIKINLINGDYYPHSYVLVDFGGQRGWENTFHNTLPLKGAGPWFTFGRNHFWINTTDGPVMIPPATRPASQPGRQITMAMMKDNEDYRDLDRSRSWTRIARRKPAQAYSTEGLGTHKVNVTLNYDPPPRLRLYQFDAFHHDTAVWSPH